MRLAWGAAFAVVGLGLLWVLRPVLAVLAASAAIAYLLDPLVDWFEARGMARETGIVAIFGGAVLAVALTVLLFVPAVGHQVEVVGARIGPVVGDLDRWLGPAVARVEDWTGRDLGSVTADLKTELPRRVAAAWPAVQERALAVLRGLFTQGLGVISALLNVALTPIFVFYLLRDWDRLVAGIADLVPPRHRPRVGRVAREVDQRLNAFVRGQITVCLALAAIYSVGLLVVGIDLAVPVGTLAGALFIVPYLGTAVGVVLGTVLALVKFGLSWKVVGVWLVFGGAQLVEGYVLTPRIVGDKVGLHPLVVMIALIVGGSLMGIWGMLIAIPVTAVLSVLAGEWLAMYRASRAYRGG